MDNKTKQTINEAIKDSDYDSIGVAISGFEYMALKYKDTPHEKKINEVLEYLNLKYKEKVDETFSKFATITEANIVRR